MERFATSKRPATDVVQRKTLGCGYKAFTLIELLVVIAVIALLVAILIPALGLAREQATKVVCEAHMKGLGMALRMYVDDYGKTHKSPNQGLWDNAWEQPAVVRPVQDHRDTPARYSVCPLGQIILGIEADWVGARGDPVSETDVFGIRPAVGGLACRHTHQEKQHHKERENQLIHTPVSP